MTQLVQPNLTVTGKSGYCLEMQENVWGSLHWYKYAEQAWNSSSADNHPGEQPPNNVCVLVYWTYFDTKDNAEYGHVATWVPGRGVYSSTFNTALGAEWYPSIQAMTNRINQIPGAKGRYLGWSGVIANVRVIKGENMAVITTEQRVALALGTIGTQPQDPADAAWDGKSDQGSLDAMITKYSQLGQARQASLEKQIADLQTQLQQNGTVLKSGKYIVP